MTIREALLSEVKTLFAMGPTAIVYSDGASMANGNNGESILPMVTHQIVEEPETGLVPQAQAQPVARLFGDQRIFVNAPQYHWHVQAAYCCLGIAVTSVWSSNRGKRAGVVAPAGQCG